MSTFPTSSPFDPRGVLRPNVVWFGEGLPSEALTAAEYAAMTCDVFMSVGTSAVVWPAAGFIQQAAARGATTVEVCAEATAISEVVDWSVRGRAGEVLPRIVGIEL
jgi:NAD-dependent deacetylase